MLKVVEKDYNGKKYEAVVYVLDVNGVETEIIIKCNSRFEYCLLINELKKEKK